MAELPDGAGRGAEGDPNFSLLYTQVHVFTQGEVFEKENPRVYFRNN